MRRFYSDELTKNTVLTQDENDWVYNGFDSCVTLEITLTLLEQLDEVSRSIYERSKALQGPILEMATRGIKVDVVRRDQVLREFKSDIAFLKAQLNTITAEAFGFTVNWSSPAQLKAFFYEFLQLKPIKKRNALGVFAPTVNRDAIEKLQQYMFAEPFCIRLLLLRDLEKKRQFLETEIDPDGRIRSSFNIAGTNTGRLASALSDMGTGTNLQNVDRKLRSVFVADPGMKFGNFDLGQADARNVGALCWEYFLEERGEEFAGSYLNACESGDLHTSTCKLAWTDLPWTGDKKADRKIADQLAYREDSYRQLAKKLGHGTNYYGQPPTMAKHTKMPVSLISDFQGRYFRGFPCIPAWHSHVKRMIADHSQITTLYGRRRWFWGRATEDSTLREAIAYAPQSMTADEINIGMLQLYREGIVQLCVQVHDSLLVQYPEEKEAEHVPRILKALEAPLILKRDRHFLVPVDGKTGWNWGDVEYNKDGSVKDNESGLKEWKGNDQRVRTSHKSSILQRRL